jgi:hypothetical protein
MFLTEDSKMKIKNKEELIDLIAQRWTDGCDTEALMQFFYEHQYDFLDSKTDSELVDILDMYDIKEDYLDYLE